MTISRDEVLHIARLAEIAVDEAELATLVSQLNRIVDYVAQLEAAPDEGQGDDFLPGPARVALRDDRVRSEPLAHPPATLAPAWRDGYFVVPRLSAMEDA